MRPSIRQVAEHARVSPMTVSRVLRGRKSQVADETFERVMGSVRELGYVPVASALQNRHVQTGSIGVVPYHGNIANNPIDAQTFEGLCGGARAHSRDLLVMLRDDEDWMSHVSARFLDRRTDGFIFISPDVREWQSILRELQLHDLPTVVCYRRDVPTGVAWVDPDNAQIAHLAVAHLREHGHKRLAYLSGPRALASFDDCARGEAFLQEAERFGMDEPLILEGATDDWRLHPDVLARLQSAGISGVLAVNDFLALQFWEAAEHAGLSIPRDFSLVGVDDQDTPHRGLSSVGFGYANIGKKAVEAWMALQSGQNASDCCRNVPVHLVKRASVGAPRTN